MLLVDTVKHKIFEDEELKEYYAKKQPYGEWLDSNLVELHDLKIPNIKVEEFSDEERARLQKAFGYTYEEYRKSILEMALNGSEGTAAMGVDTPLAVLSKQHRPLFDYLNSFCTGYQRQSMRSVRRSLPVPPFMWEKTATF